MALVLGEYGCIIQMGIPILRKKGRLILSNMKIMLNFTELAD